MFIVISKGLLTMSNEIFGSPLRVVGRYLKLAKTQLEMGEKVEKEHTDVYKMFETYLKKHDLKMPLSRKEFFRTIAKAHIKELKDYYDRLEKIEGGAHKEAMDFTSISTMIRPDKKLDDRELVSVLRLSQAAELDAVHLYELIADATDNTTVKKVAQSVADEEKVHAGEFGALIDKLDKTNKKLLEEGAKEVEDMKSEST